MFFTYSRGESSADKRSKNQDSTKKVNDDELKVIKTKEIDDEPEVIKRKTSNKEIEEEFNVIRENLQRKKLYSIKKEINEDYNVIKRRFLRKIFKKRK